MDLSIYPLSFFVSFLALIPCSLFAWKHRREGWGLPMLAVLGTTAVWYHGDGIYNDYEEYRLLIGDDALNAAWWQVGLFVISFSCMVRPLHQTINKKLLGRASYAMSYATTTRINDPSIQRQIDMLAKYLLIAWLILMAIALARKGFDYMPMFFPYLEGYRLKPWSRGRVGGGFSALVSMAAYLQIMFTAGFVIVAALARNPKTRTIAIIVCFLALPYYIFDRTRNPMIATMLPGFLAWVFLRLRANIIIKTAILVTAFVLTSYWFKFVVDSRMGRGATIATAFEEAREKKVQKSGGIVADDIIVLEDNTKQAKHRGLNMFAELGYINNFIVDGSYTPNMGMRYFAEVVNVIPRGIWANKPSIGLDYAAARGFASSDVSDVAGGVLASISTGMIGQGVVNFGRFFGVIFAGLLMSIWVAIIARQDLLGKSPMRLFLYSMAIILSFNLGRDITLITLFPFVFAYVMVLWIEYWMAKARSAAMPVVRGSKTQVLDRQDRL